MVGAEDDKTRWDEASTQDLLSDFPIVSHRLLDCG